MTFAQFEEVIAWCTRCERDEVFARDVRSFWTRAAPETKIASFY
jgi:hypothetical protein